MKKPRVMAVGDTNAVEPQSAVSSTDVVSCQRWYLPGCCGPSSSDSNGGASFFLLPFMRRGDTDGTVHPSFSSCPHHHQKPHQDGDCILSGCHCPCRLASLSVTTSTRANSASAQRQAAHFASPLTALH